MLRTSMSTASWAVVPKSTYPVTVVKAARKVGASLDALPLNATDVRAGSSSQVPDARAVVASNVVSSGCGAARVLRPSCTDGGAATVLPSGSWCGQYHSDVASQHRRRDGRCAAASLPRRTAGVRITTGASAVTLIADIPAQR